MNVLCTGGAGYVGSACLRRLLRFGYDAVAYDNLSTGNRAAVPDGRLIVGDILDRDALERTMRDCRIGAVMHFAALASVPDSIADPGSYWLTNVIGTKNVLDAMVECDVPLILFSSTAATYAFTSDMPLTESSLQDPHVPYGTTKLTAERLIHDYARAYGLGYTFLRYFNASGADPDGTHGEARAAESHLIPLIFGVATGRREKLTVYGGDWPTPDGTCIRDYVHTTDLAAAHQLALETLEPGMGRAYNVGSGSGSSVLEVIGACESVIGRSIPYEVVERRPGDPAVLIASPSKLEQELGWKRRYDRLSTIVETAWAWHRIHPDGYATSSSMAGPLHAETRSE